MFSRMVDQGVDAKFAAKLSLEVLNHMLNKYGIEKFPIIEDIKGDLWNISTGCAYSSECAKFLTTFVPETVEYGSYLGELATGKKIKKELTEPKASGAPDPFALELEVNYKHKPKPKNVEIYDEETSKLLLKPDDAVKQDIYEQYVLALVESGIDAKEAEQAVADAILNNEFEATKGKEIAVAAAIPLIYEGVAFISAAILAKMVGDELAKKYAGSNGGFEDAAEEINSEISAKESSEYYKKQYEKSKTSGIKQKVTTAANSGGMPDPDDDFKKYEKYKKDDGSGRYECERAESPEWKNLKNFKDEYRTNGLSGKSKKYFRWDTKHKDIEIYDYRGRYLGSKDPVTGKSYRLGNGVVDKRLARYL